MGDENLGPTCGPNNLDLCDDAAKKQIAKFQKWDIDELEMQIEENDAKLVKIKAEAEKKVKGYESQMEDLNEKISATNKKKDEKIAKETKKMGLRFMKEVSASKKPKKEEEDPDRDPDLDEKPSADL